MNLSANHESQPELELTQAMSGVDKIILTPDALSS